MEEMQINTILDYNPPLSPLLVSEENTIQPSVSTPFLFLRERDGDRVEDEIQCLIFKNQGENG